MVFRKKGESAKPPTLANASPLREQPANVEKTQRINVLSAARNKIVAAIGDCELRLGTAISAQAFADNQVEAALKFAETGIVQMPANGVGALRDEHAQLRGQLEYVDRELEKLRQSALELERTLSAQCYAANRDVHVDILTRYAAKLRELDAVVAEEEAFFNAMHAAGYSYTPPDMALWLTLGTLADPNSTISMRLRELRPYDNAA